MTDWREMVSDEAMPLGHQQAAELPTEQDEFGHTAECRSHVNRSSPEEGFEPKPDWAAGCTCPLGYRGLGVLYGISLGNGWIRLRDAPDCPIHGDSAIVRTAQS